MTYWTEHSDLANCAIPTTTLISVLTIHLECWNYLILQFENERIRIRSHDLLNGAQRSSQLCYSNHHIDFCFNHSLECWNYLILQFENERIRIRSHDLLKGAQWSNQLRYSDNHIGLCFNNLLEYRNCLFEKDRAYFPNKKWNIKLNL